MKPGFANVHGWAFREDKAKGYAPYFQKTLSYRVNKKLATNVVITGEAGIGKTYLGTDICRVRDRRFNIPQVVFMYSEYLDLTLHLRMGRPITFDEPSYAMGKRDWYKDLNKALVQTIESSRFKVHPLFIPIINKSLLDKTIRSYLVQFQIVMTDRGVGTVYRVLPSQFKDKVYLRFFCRLKYHMFDSHLCKVSSCLDCKKLHEKDANDVYVCRIFRARYERKKESIQYVRYVTAKEKAETREMRELSFGQVYDILKEKVEDLRGPDGMVSIGKIMKESHLGRSKSYAMKGLLDELLMEKAVVSEVPSVTVKPGAEAQRQAIKMTLRGITFKKQVSQAIQSQGHRVSEGYGSKEPDIIVWKGKTTAGSIVAVKDVQGQKDFNVGERCGAEINAAKKHGLNTIHLVCFEGNQKLFDADVGFNEKVKIKRSEKERNDS